MVGIGLVAPLFVPATRPERITKAANSGADAIIVDLEDAVPAGAKVSARDSLAMLSTTRVPAFLRINGVGTDWYEDDIGSARHAGIRLICLPKVESPAQIDEVVARLDEKAVILAQIETAVGVRNATAIASHMHVCQLAFGPADFFLDLGTRSARTLRSHVLSEIAIASRSVGKPLPVDGPAFEIVNQDLLVEECEEASDAGAGGKLCIHPSQVAPVMRCFAPSPQDIEWAERVVSADLTGSAQAVNGQMIDAPIVMQAKALLQRASALAPRE